MQPKWPVGASAHIRVLRVSVALRLGRPTGDLGANRGPDRASGRQRLGKSAGWTRSLVSEQEASNRHAVRTYKCNFYLFSLGLNAKREIFVWRSETKGSDFKQVTIDGKSGVVIDIACGGAQTEGLITEVRI